MMLYGVVILLLIVTVVFVAYQIMVMRDLSRQLDTVLSDQSQSIIKLTGSLFLYPRLVKQLNAVILERRQVRKQYQKLMIQQKQMISAMSHDFRTPLTSVLGYIELLQNGVSKDIEKKYLDIIYWRAHDLNDMLDSFYQLSRLESNELEVHYQNVDIYQLLTQQLSSYYEDLNKQFDHVEIQLEFLKLMIYSDDKLLTRVMSNLIKNALVHGMGEFKVNAYTMADCVVIEFSNHAHFDHNFDVNQLFERNFKISKDRSRQSSGLGLAIAKEIVLRIGGQLAVDYDGERIKFKLLLKK